MKRKLTKLTVKWLEHPPLGPERYDITVPNLRGLVVRVHPSGAVSFRLRYKRDERSYVMVLGEYGSKGLSMADVTAMHTQALRATWKIRQVPTVREPRTRPSRGTPTRRSPAPRFAVPAESASRY